MQPGCARHMQHSRVHACMWLRANALARMSERCARSRRSIMMAVCSWSCVLRGGEIGEIGETIGAVWAGPAHRRAPQRQPLHRLPRVESAPLGARGRPSASGRTSVLARWVAAWVRGPCRSTACSESASAKATALDRLGCDAGDERASTDSSSCCDDGCRNARYLDSALATIGERITSCR
jgi:hypothetical protein